jgi:hypothetical protein
VADNDAFEVLGQIEVDQATLRKSLASAEADVRKSADNLKRTWGDALQARDEHGRWTSGGATSGGGAGRVPKPDVNDFEPARRSVHSAGREFSHLARIARELLAGPLVGLSPEFARIANAATYASRSALYLGASLGILAVAGVAVGHVVGEYIKVAQEATKATFEANRAVDTLDFARADAGIKKITEDVGLYNLKVDQATGKVEAGFWQKVIGWVAIAQNAVTGSINEQIKKFKDLAEAQVVIGAKFELPKARAEGRKDAAELLGKEAQAAMKNATSQEELRAAYDDVERSIKGKTAASRDAIAFDEEKAEAGLKTEAGIANKQIDVAKKVLESDLRLVQAKRDIAMSGYALRKTNEEEAVAREKYAKAVEASSGAIVAVGNLRNQKEEEFSIKRRKIDGDETLELAKNSEERAKAAVRGTVEDEAFFQKDVQRQQKRVEAAAKAAESISQHEEDARQRRRAAEGLVESGLSLEVRLADTRKRALDPLEAEVATERSLYESRRQSILVQIEAGIDAIKNKKELGDLDREYTSKSIELAEKRGTKVAELGDKEDAARAKRYTDTVAQEDRVLQHRVEMGRATLALELERARAGATDPRRTAAQRDTSEERAQKIQTEMTEAYFQQRRSLGQNVLGEELRYYESLTAQQEVGSRKWFEDLNKIADVNRQIIGLMEAQKALADATLSTGVEDLKQHGRKSATLKEMYAAERHAREQDSTIIGVANRGGRVNIDQYMQARQRQQSFGGLEMAARGGDKRLGGMMQGALDWIGGGNGRYQPWGRPGAEEVTDPLAGATKGADAFAKALDDVTGGIGTFGDMLARVRADQGDDSKLGRRLFLESQRGPVTQEAVG